MIQNLRFSIDRRDFGVLKSIEKAKLYDQACPDTAVYDANRQFAQKKSISWVWSPSVESKGIFSTLPSWPLENHIEVFYFQAAKRVWKHFIRIFDSDLPTLKMGSFGKNSTNSFPVLTFLLLLYLLKVQGVLRLFGGNGMYVGM